MIKKLLLIGPTHNPIHLTNFFNLVADYFDEVRVVSDSDFVLCKHYKLNFSLKNPLKLRKSIRELRNIMNEYKPSVVQVHQANSYAYITTLANKGKFPQILTTWGSDVLLMPQKNRVFKYLAKYSIKHSDYVTANAHFMAEAIQKLVKKKVLVANYGIDYEGVELPIEKEKMIYANRFHAELYRTDEIIRGFSQFVKHHPDWKLIVAGKGDLTGDLKKLALEICPPKTVEFVGFVSSEENKGYYLKSHIWVSFPISDGAAISLYEAMGYGCVPVTSNLITTKEVVNHNSNGVIVDVDLNLGFEKALQLDINQVQELNKAIVLKTATRQVNKAKFESIYDEIIKKKASSLI